MMHIYGVKNNLQKPMKEIVLCFLDITSEALEDNILNKLAAYVAPKTSRKRNGKVAPIVHVELWFRESNNTGFSCSICYGKQVHWHNKNFSRVWSFRSLYTTDEAYAKIKSWCLLQRGCKFNGLGFYALGAGLRIPGTWPSFFGFRNRYFCSELVTTALKHGEIFPKSQSTVIHPEKLFNLIAPISSVTSIKERNFSSITY